MKSKSPVYTGKRLRDWCPASCGECRPTLNAPLNSVRESQLQLESAPGSSGHRRSLNALVTPDIVGDPAALASAELVEQPPPPPPAKNCAICTSRVLGDNADADSSLGCPKECSERKLGMFGGKKTWTQGYVFPDGVCHWPGAVTMDPTSCSRSCCMCACDVH
jgi:hypothetical protein